MKKVIIKLGNGELDSGFNSVNIELQGDARTPWQDLCSLRAAPELKSSLNQWELLYREIVRLNQDDFPRGVKFAEHAITNVSIQDLRNLHDRLKIELNQWLASSDFCRIEKSLRTKLNDREKIAVIIQASQRSIWQLPWYLWDFFADYPLAVEVFSKPQNSELSNIHFQPNGKVDILALFGTDPLLNLDRDFQCLQSLPDVHLHSFETTSATDITDRLNLHTPDILYVSGHGESVEYESDCDGIIYLNPQTPLEIGILKPELKKAVELGLKIAIFNCCSGLGIAHQLSDVYIPYLIVMRAEIPNRIAQDFLENLLSEYSNGADFVRAFQLARARISISTESWLKFANWLPVLFHNPLSYLFSWQDAIETKKSGFFTNFQQTISLPKYRIWTGFGISLAIAGLSICLKSVAEPFGTKIEPIDRLENIAIDLLSQLQSPDDRPLILLEYTPVRVLGKLNDPTILTAAIDKIDRNTKPQAFITDSNFAKYLPTNLAEQWKLNQRLLARLKSIKIEKLEELSPNQIKETFTGKIIIISELNTLSNSPLISVSVASPIENHTDLNSNFNLLKIRSKSEDFIWIFGWCSLTTLVAWRMKERFFASITIAAFGSQIILSGTLLLLGNGMPIVMTSIAILAARSLDRLLHKRSSKFN